MGTVAEAVRQSVGGGGRQSSQGQAGSERQRGRVKQYMASDANAERLAETLCRMRGAALKLGQMLSIQVRWVPVLRSYAAGGIHTKRIYCSWCGKSRQKNGSSEVLTRVCRCALVCDSQLCSPTVVELARCVC